MKIWSTNLDQTNFQLEITKKVLGLKTYQQLLSMRSIYLSKICVNFSELFLLNYNENAIFFFKITQKNCRGTLFLEKFPLHYVMFGGCPYFLSNTLDKVYSYRLKNT